MSTGGRSSLKPTACWYDVPQDVLVFHVAKHLYLREVVLKLSMVNKATLEVMRDKYAHSVIIMAKQIAVGYGMAIGKHNTWKKITTETYFPSSEKIRDVMQDPTKSMYGGFGSYQILPDQDFEAYRRAMTLQSRIDRLSLTATKWSEDRWFGVLDALTIKLPRYVTFTCDASFDPSSALMAKIDEFRCKIIANRAKRAGSTLCDIVEYTGLEFIVTSGCTKAAAMLVKREKIRQHMIKKRAVCFISEIAICRMPYWIEAFEAKSNETGDAPDMEFE